MSKENKTITATDMLKESNSYALQKIFENTHKGNILEKEFSELKKRLDEEIAELKKAMAIFYTNRTAKNCVSLCREGGDCIVFISAIMAKALGYEVFKRE